ncbi:hypothetical protein ACFLY5_00015 [Patescibacteria group bacterium]
MNKLIRPLVTLSVLALLAGMLYFFLSEKEVGTISSLSLTAQAEISANSAMTWLINYEESYKDPGVVWVIDKINDDYCDNKQLRSFVLNRFKEFENHPVEFAYKKLIDDNYSYEIDYEILTGRESFFDDIMMPAVYCADHEIKPETLGKIFDVGNISEYDLSHRFLAMLIMQKNNCTEDLEYHFDRYLLEAKNKIIDEQNKSAVYNDIYSERVAFLLFGGFDTDVKEEWIDEIIKNQSSAGAWSDPKHFNKVDNPHTTALSLWALAGYTKKCPLY